MKDRIEEFVCARLLLFFLKKYFLIWIDFYIGIRHLKRSNHHIDEFKTAQTQSRE